MADPSNAQEVNDNLVSGVLIAAMSLSGPAPTGMKINPGTLNALHKAPQSLEPALGNKPAPAPAAKPALHAKPSIPAMKLH